MSKLTGVRRKSPSKRGKKAQYFDEVVRLHYEEGLNGNEISRIIPVHCTNIYRWLDEYDMQKKSKTSSMEETSVRTETNTPRRVTGISAPETTVTPLSEAEPESMIAKIEADEVSLLKERVRELEKQLREKERSLKETTLRADLYNEIINVAEKKYKVPIRKKAGTKQ